MGETMSKGRAKLAENGSFIDQSNFGRFASAKAISR